MTLYFSYCTNPKVFVLTCDSFIPFTAFMETRLVRFPRSIYGSTPEEENVDDDYDQSKYHVQFHCLLLDIKSLIM